MHAKYYKLFRDQEAYREARQAFEESFLEKHDLLDHLSREDAELTLRDVLDNPEKARAHLKDTLANFIFKAWLRHLEGLLEDTQQAA